MTELSDELLVAYVDGQLAGKQSSAIAKVLAQDDVIAKRVASLREAHRRLEAAFEAVLAGEEADATSRPIPPSPGLLLPWDMLVKGGLAAAGLVVAIGLIFAGHGWPLDPPDILRLRASSADTDYVGSLPDWHEEVARAQVLLSRAGLEMGLDSQGNRDLMAVELQRAIGAELAPPDLSAQGFHFVRAQLLNFGGEPLAELLYLGPSGAPLALYAKKGGEGAVPEAKRYGTLTGIAWSEGGLDYLLAGEGDEASLQRLARAAQIAVTSAR